MNTKNKLICFGLVIIGGVSFFIGGYEAGRKASINPHHSSTSHAAFITPLPGTKDAARYFVPGYLGRVYTVTDEPIMKNDMALVKARLFNRNCVVELKKELNSNDAGWIVQKFDCQ